MRRAREIPGPTIERLCKYHRVLARARRQGMSYISSAALAHLTGLSPAQVRKDFSYFGSFGRRGVGYEVHQLLSTLKRLLGLERGRRVAIVGVGHLGSALAGYPGLHSRGFQVAGLYDNNPARIGHLVHGMRVRDVASLAADHAAVPIDIAVLTVPEGAAQAAAEQVVNAGITALLNFTPVALRLPPHVLVRDIDMTAELEYLSFCLSARARAQDEQGG
jgi:redox-sensing transcriptional repressor